MKTFDYIIVLKKRNHSTVDWVSQIMLLIAIIAFIGNGINGLYNALSSYAFAVLVIGWGAFCIWQKKKGGAPFYRFGARGTLGSPSSYFAGKIKAIVAYNRALDSTELTSVYNYLNAL